MRRPPKSYVTPISSRVPLHIYPLQAAAKEPRAARVHRVGASSLPETLRFIRTEDQYPSGFEYSEVGAVLLATSLATLSQQSSPSRRRCFASMRATLALLDVTVM